MPHIVVFTVVQNLSDAKAHMVTDINDVAIRNGHNSSKLKYAAHANGNITLGRISDVYDAVKGIDKNRTVKLTGNGSIDKNWVVSDVSSQCDTMQTKSTIPIYYTDVF